MQQNHKTNYMRKSIVLFLILATYFSNAQQVPATVAERIRSVENSLAPAVVFGDSIPSFNLEQEMMKRGIVGLSIAVVKDFKLDWAKGYGWADTDEKRPVTTATRFQAASISKSVSSLGMLKLVQQGKIDLNADINNYLKTWKFPYDSLSKNKKITLRNLLTHSAGLSVHGFPGYEAMTPLPTITQILDGITPSNSPAVRSQFAPDLRFQYSGGGTTISQLILTDVTGRNYAEFMEKEVLAPIGMKNSFYTQPPAKGTKDLASAYNKMEEVPGQYHIYPEQAAAALWTTPTDLAAFIIETQLTLQGKSGKVINQQMMQQRLAPYIDSSVTMGAFLIRKGSDKYFSHNGGNNGFLCTYLGSFEKGNGVVVMINSDNFSIINDVVNSVARTYQWENFYKPEMKTVISKEGKKLTLPKYVGNYNLEGDTITLRMCGDDLCGLENGDEKAIMKLQFTSDTEAALPDMPGATIKMVVVDGKVTGFDFKQGPTKLFAKKME